MKSVAGFIFAVVFFLIVMSVARELLAALMFIYVSVGVLALIGGVISFFSSDEEAPDAPALPAGKAATTTPRTGAGEESMRLGYLSSVLVDPAQARTPAERAELLAYERIREAFQALPPGIEKVEVTIKIRYNEDVP